MSNSIEQLRNEFNKLEIDPSYKEIISNEGFFEEFKFHNLPCRIIRNYSGCWCGYVILPKNHQDYKKLNCDYEIESIYDVHGGITFISSFDIEGSIFNGYVWIGFDCSHSGDLSPIKSKYGYLSGYETYKDINYVKNEVVNLAEQVYNRSLNKKIKDVLTKI